MSIRDITLTDTVSIPQLGFGVFKVDPDQTQQAVEQALEAGYRHIDTAAVYGNEEGVGRALAASGLARDDVFVTTKLWNSEHGSDKPRPAIEHSLELLGLDAVDLYLIHWPTPERGTAVDTWAAVTALQEAGLTRSAGVSNFRIDDLESLSQAGLATPSINQVELHPLLAQGDLREYHASHGIVTEAWSPLAQGAVLDDPAVTAIAEKHGATPAQVVLAWHLALGNVVIPKSVTPERIASNLASSEVDLDVEEIAALTALDRGERVGPDPSTFHVE